MCRNWIQEKNCRAGLVPTAAVPTVKISVSPGGWFGALHSSRAVKKLFLVFVWDWHAVCNFRGLLCFDSSVLPMQGK